MYEPELVNYLTMIFTTLIAVFWASCFIHGLSNEKIDPIQFSDKFDIGYIEGDDPVVVVEQPKKTKKKKKKSKKPKSKPKPKAKPKPKPKPRPEPKPKPEPKIELNEELMRDCVSVLVNLGTKKPESKRAVAEFFRSNPETKTVEQFIEVVFKK